MTCGAIFNVPYTPCKFQKILKTILMIERNNISKYLINEWIISFTHWDNKVMVWVNSQITPVKTFFIFNSKNFAIKPEWQIINKWHFLYAITINLKIHQTALYVNYKTDPHCGSKKEERNYGKVKNNEKMSTIMPFIQFFFYLKQQTNILWCFCSLKFEKRFFSNKFFIFIFRKKW